MKVIKAFPAPHVEMRVSVSERMEADMKECFKNASDKDGGTRNCDTCSWCELDIFGTGLCEIPALTDKVLGRDGKD